MAGLDPDAFTRCYQLTRSMYRDVYPALDPSEPALSAKGKTVLITGAGGTVPSAVALAWAKAGATTVVLIGRTLKSLEDIANKIRIRYEAIRTIVITTDTTNEVEVANLFSTLQQQHDIRLDVLVQGAGAMNNAGSVEKVPNEWWQDFEANVKGPYLMNYYYLRHLQGSTGTVIVLGSMAPIGNFPGMSSYASSKLAVTKMMEFFHQEHENLRCFTVTPGNVLSQLTNPAFIPFANDTGELCGAMTLYLSTSKADYLKGRFVSVNWDVEEMEKHQDEIQEKCLLKLGYINATLGPNGHPWTLQ